jgi:hypothetical protein
MKVQIRLLDHAGRAYEGAVQLVAVPDAKETAAPSRVDVPNQTKGLPGQIIALRDGGFFSEPRTPADVHEKLSVDYHCILNRVQMALLRLQRRRDLRKAVENIGGESISAYVW